MNLTFITAALVLSLFTSTYLMSSPAENTTKVTKKHSSNGVMLAGVQAAQDMTNPFWSTVCRRSLMPIKPMPPSMSEFFRLQAMLSYERFGMSETKLEDGRTILIAGEHEDYYDPDFFIYNDVIVKDANERFKSSAIPKTSFQPLTFTVPLSSATVSTSLAPWLHRQAQEKDTPVYYLDLKDYTIHQVNSGQALAGSSSMKRSTNSRPTPSPSIVGKRWIDSGDIIDNFSKWQLKLDTKQWTLVEERPWSQFRFSRKDGESNLLFDVRLDMPPIDASTFEDPDTPMDQETKEKKQKDILKKVYERKSKHSSRPIKKPWTNSIDLASPHTLHPQTEEEDEHSRFRLTVNG
ncbi:hypothetical protein [Rubritalea tangerina]|uniref:hypothetical protein n=1 Tax=Rubritalea tangerina TaxID=430798 RepID=UPI0036062EC0